MNLSTLEGRLKHEIPEEYHQAIEEQIDQFESEISRMSRDQGKIGQATLTDREIKRAPTTNQHGEEGFTVVQLQVIKAAAIQYGVRDWLSHLDKTLTVGENIALMERHGTRNNKTTLRMMKNAR